MLKNKLDDEAYENKKVTKRKVKIVPLDNLEEASKEFRSAYDAGCLPKRVVEEEKEAVVVGSSGAKSSKTQLYYHDVPPELFRRIALRHTVGHKKHNDDPIPITMNLNWRQGLSDPFYVMDRLNHMFEHMVQFLEDGDTLDDNLAAIVWNAGFLMEVERRFPRIIGQIVGQCKLAGEHANTLKVQLQKEQKVEK